MLVITELKIGSYEIADAYRTEDRNKFIQYRLGNRILFILSSFLVISQLFSLKDSILGPIIAIIFGFTGIAITTRIEMRINRSIGEELSGFVIYFNEEKELISLLVRNWKSKSHDEFLEKEVRFNQSIGFQAILENDGIITIDLIVDPDYPGTTIFMSWDFFTIAELILLFQKALPNLDKWFYKTNEGEEWPEKYKRELNEEMLVAKVPWEIRDFFN